MSTQTPNSPTLMDFKDSSTDSERTLSEISPEDIPPIVIDADFEGDEITSTMSTMVDMQQQRILGKEPLEVVPLTRVPLRGQEVHVPQWLKEHDYYKDGDWRVFHRVRSNRRKDWVSDSSNNFCSF